ncbi:MAG: sialate O-acetylesterase [Bryobacter sp.]|nr:sialate O-acetylesterase [Bryobacter sp.]
MRCLFVLAVWASALSAQPMDLFLLVGQSNMAGRGVVDTIDRVPLPQVWMFTAEEKWELSKDPVHFDRPDRTGTGLGRSFGATLVRFGASRKVGLIPAAFGGSSLAEWQPGEKHYLNAVARAKAALAKAPAGSRLRGILWHQGEADTAKQELAETYQSRFLVFVRQLRADLGAGGLPVVVGQLGEFLKERPENPHPFAPQVNQALATVPLVLEKAAFASSAGLGHKGDQLHFSSPALREFGRRYALAWLALTEENQ